MVFHVFERVFGNLSNPQQLLRGDPRKDQLIEEGFSSEEADNLSWFYFRQTYGKIYGTLGGLAVVYFMNPYYNGLARSFPRLYYQKWIGTMLKCGIVFLGLQIGDYISIARREGANQWISNLYNNNYYIRSKESFIRNFEVLNRKFTDEEVEKFNINKEYNPDYPRRFNYNPYIHGENEAEFWEKVKSYRQKGAIYNRKDVIEKVLAENTEKIKAGEIVNVKPYDITEDVDKSGRKNRLDNNPVIYHYKALN